MNMITLTIDGMAVKAKNGMSILEAAKSAGIYIPTLCYDPDLKPYGVCRICIVEIGKKGSLLPACYTPVEEKMIVTTDSPEIEKIRRLIVELIVVNHSVDCMVCSKSGQCELQKIVAYMGIEEKRLQRLKRVTKSIHIDTSNPFFNRDLNKCIFCTRCIRVCREVIGVNAINLSFRGYSSKVTTFGDKSLIESKCESCGECVVRCPTGALIRKNYQRPAREVKTICPYCGTGCGIYLGMRGSEIISVRGDSDSPVNKGQLCAKGRFGYHFINHSDRLTTPLVKRNGTFVEATWDEALEIVVSNIKKAQNKYGPEALAGLSSAKVTNEENYLFQKLLRSLGTNSVDCCARLCHAATVVALSTVLGSAAMTNTIDEIPGANAILVMGTNPTESEPIIGYRIREAVRNGAKLIVADPRRISLAEIADIHLQFKPGTDIALCNALAHVIIRDGLFDTEYIKNRTQGFEYLKEFVEKYTPEYVSKITGVSSHDITDAARLFATAGRAGIFYSMGVTQQTCGAENVAALTNLSLLTGNLGVRHAGINPLRGQNNVQGACDMGCLPNVFTGYQPVYGDRYTDTYWRRLKLEEGKPVAPPQEEIDTSEIIANTIEFERPVYKGMSISDEIRAKFSKAWGVKLSDVPGRTMPEMFHENPSRRCQVIYIMGEDPVLTAPNGNHVRECLEGMDFVVVQDIFLTETAQYADIILPAATFAEKDGTFINTERRVQRIRKAVEPRGDSKPDWEILQLLANKFNFKWNYNSTEEIWDEIRKLTPHYFGGMSYSRLEKIGLQWPCPTEDHPATPIMHKDKFARGIGQFSTVEYRPMAAEPTDEKYPFILTTARKLYQYHTRSMTGKTDGLNYLLKEELMEINPHDAERLRLNSNDMVVVTSRRGSIKSKIRITDSVPIGVVCMSFHFAETATNIITDPAVCNMSVASGLKVTAVDIKKSLML